MANVIESFQTSFVEHLNTRPVPNADLNADGIAVVDDTGNVIIQFNSAKIGKITALRDWLNGLLEE